MTCRAIKIIEPIDGAILNRTDGIEDAKSLTISVKGIAPWKSKVKVNDVEADVVRNGCGNYDKFSCKVALRDIENKVIAYAESGGKITTDIITVLWEKKSYKRYRFSIDDNILFLKDLAINATKYESIFDNEYMYFWKQMHDKYGTKIQFNIFYQTEGFNLSQMPEKYKSEWQENSDWIRLAFHAFQDEPPNPYVNATYQEMMHDFSMVTNEIVRFAGKDLLSPFIILHWGEATLEACKALRDNGIKGLFGVFVIDPDINRPFISYYLNEETTKYLDKHDYWKDTKEGIIFIKHDLVINVIMPEDIVPTLDSIASDPHISELMEVGLHEQYFHPELSYYEPDVKERVINTLEWLEKNNYQSVLYDKHFLGDK